MRSALMNRLERLEGKRNGGGGLWVISTFADDPREDEKREAAERYAIEKLRASENDLFIAVRSFSLPEGGQFPERYQISAGGSVAAAIAHANGKTRGLPSEYAARNSQFSP